jgi:hypothetical protein
LCDGYPSHDVNCSHESINLYSQTDSWPSPKKTVSRPNSD